MRTLTRRIRALLALTPLALVAGASAQQIPAPESGPAVVRVVTNGDQIEMRDASTGAAIQMPRAQGWHVPRPNADTVAPRVEVRVQPSGYDLVYTFKNEKSYQRPLGALNVGILTLGRTITTHDFRWDGKPYQARATAQDPIRAWNYPTYLYSPVAVLRSNGYAVGVSIHYPILEYKHDVVVKTTSPTGSASVGEGGRGWNVQFRLNNFGDERDYQATVLNEAFLPAGEERTYVVSVRVTKAPSEWIRTLEPYRNFFQTTYGGPRYTRDERPVRGITMAGDWLLSASNPMGFAEQSVRPDLHGFGPWASRLRGMAGDVQRVMIWKPSGVFRQNRQLNYPFRFTSRWMEVPKLNDAVEQLRTVAAAGIEVGLWWGRSTQVMRSWDCNAAEWLNPDNSEHVEIAFRELDLAVQAGVTLIGLDYYTPGRETPLWNLHKWLLMMQERAPGVKFVTEARNCDIMHTLAATLFDVYPTADEVRRGENNIRVQSPFYLADLLVPGHETWGALPFDRVRDLRGTPMPPAEQRSEMGRVSGAGYALVAFNMERLRGGYNAAPSWESTVPADVRARAAALPRPSAPGAGSGDSTPPPSQTAQTETRGVAPPGTLTKSNSQSDKLSVKRPTASQKSKQPAKKP